MTTPLANAVNRQVLIDGDFLMASVVMVVAAKKVVVVVV